MGTASGINPKTPRRSSTQTNTHPHTHNTVPTHLHHVTKAAYKRPLHMARAQPPTPGGRAAHHPMYEEIWGAAPET